MEPPNQKQIEADLHAVIKAIPGVADAHPKWRREQTIRSDDPYISCSTHRLDLAQERQ